MANPAITRFVGGCPNPAALKLLVGQLIEVPLLVALVEQRTTFPARPSEPASHASELAFLWQQLGEINGSIKDLWDMKMNIHDKERDVRMPLYELDDRQDPEPLLRIFEIFIAPYYKVLYTIRKDLESRRDSIRADINTATRPLIRPLKVLDLPNELLRCIFDYVRGWTSDSETFFSDMMPGDIRQIKHLRLTCHRFRDTSSHLLLRHVTVDLTPASIARLEDISRHPTISKGVIAVGIVLEFYSATLAEDIQSFARYHEIQLADHVDIWDWWTRRPALEFISRKDHQRAARKGRAIMESWNDVASNGVDEDDDRVGTMVLRRAHERYRNLWADQVALLEGNFPRAITSAMARFPIATWISIYDSEGFTEHSKRSFLTPMFAAIDNPGLLEQNLVQPVETWDSAQRHGLDDVPANILTELFIATQESGIPLSGLSIWTPPPIPMTRLLPTNEGDHGKLRAAVKHLKSVHFQPRHLRRSELWAEREGEEWAPFLAYLGILLDSAQLREIHLQLQFMWTSSLPPVVSIGPVLFSRVWPNLESLSFYGPFHLEELMQLITQARKKIRLELSGYLSKLKY
jgi:hypothetical protein